MSRLSISSLAVLALIVGPVIAPFFFATRLADHDEVSGNLELVTLGSFDQFVEVFDEYEDVPRIVLLLSPT